MAGPTIYSTYGENYEKCAFAMLKTTDLSMDKNHE